LLYPAELLTRNLCIPSNYNMRFKKRQAKYV